VLLFGLLQFVSLLFGNAFGPDFKAWFGYIIEVALFYVIISEYIQIENDFAKLLSNICYGLASVAILATVQKYFHFNIVDKILPPEELWGNDGDIASTYPHRILMGYAMAMGVPLSLALASYEKEAKPRRIMYSITLLLIGANYFSMSRGPWLGLLFATIGMAVFCGKATRKKLLFLVVLTAAVCILRPGVRDSITNLCRGTFDPDSEKNSDYQYRWQLWGVAWDQIRLSPVRLLFGYGPDSAEGMDLSDYWHGEEGSTSSITKIGFTSWDNNYACDLIQLGILGFLTEIALHLSIVKTLLDNWRSSNPDNRILQGGIAVACLVFMFAMTNVFIFAPQLKYLFWALVAVGSNFSLVVANQETKEPALELNDSVEPAPRAASLAEGEATI
jgi:O-antigen ligase